MESATRENREETFSKEMKQKDFLELKDVILSWKALIST